VKLRKRCQNDSNLSHKRKKRHSLPRECHSFLSINISGRCVHSWWWAYLNFLRVNRSQSINQDINTVKPACHCAICATFTRDSLSVAMCWLCTTNLLILSCDNVKCDIICIITSTIVDNLIGVVSMQLLLGLLHFCKSDEIFGGVKRGTAWLSTAVITEASVNSGVITLMPAADWTVILINVVLSACQVYKLLSWSRQLLLAIYDLRPNRGFASRPHWGTSVPKPQNCAPRKTS